MRNRWVRRSQRSGEREKEGAAHAQFLSSKEPIRKSPLLSWEEESEGWGERPRCYPREFPPRGYCSLSGTLLPSPTRFHHGFWSPQGAQSGPIIFNKAGENVSVLLHFCGGILLTESQLCSGWQCNRLFSSPAPLHEGMAMWHNLDQWNINRILLNIYMASSGLPPTPLLLPWIEKDEVIAILQSWGIEDENWHIKDGAADTQKETRCLVVMLIPRFPVIGSGRRGRVPNRKTFVQDTLKWVCCYLLIIGIWSDSNSVSSSSFRRELHEAGKDDGSSLPWVSPHPSANPSTQTNTSHHREDSVVAISSLLLITE